MTKQLIIISGVSGAGKTTANNILEDMGYRCIDQFPSELLEDLVKLLEEDDSLKFSKVALTIPIMDLEKFENLLSNASLSPKLILITANNDTIINRYKFTRRIHPLMASNTASTLAEAIEIEKGVIEKYKNRHCHIIDTTNLSLKVHKEKLEAIINGAEIEHLAISFKSFGFKNGVPQDADIVLDTRVLDNPYYVDKLRLKTGLNKSVIDYVLDKPKTQKYLKKAIAYLDLVFKSYESEERKHITVCIGCTGGQHRSVVIANYIYKHYKNEYMCYISHRELGK